MLVTDMFRLEGLFCQPSKLDQVRYRVADTASKAILTSVVGDCFFKSINITSFIDIQVHKKKENILDQWNFGPIFVAFLKNGPPLPQFRLSLKQFLKHLFYYEIKGVQGYF